MRKIAMKAIVALCLCIGVVIAHAQTINVKGKVLAESGEALPGATITIETNSNSQKNSLTADASGAFTLTGLSASGKYNLVFEHVGYQAETLRNYSVLQGENNVLLIRMKSVNKNMDEVVVVGYGTSKKKDLTGSITRVNAARYATQASTNLSEFFTGTVAGLSANQGTTAGGGGELEIRGANSILASNSPLIVLDGVIYNGSMGDINPADVETIDILKDASAAAVYGSQSANGVIIITTKKGKKELPTIGLSVSAGYTEAARDYKPFGPGAYLQYRKDLFDIVKPQQKYYYNSPFTLPGDVSREQWRAYSNNPNANDTVEWLNRLNLNNVEIQNYRSGQTIDWYRKVMQRGLRQNYDLNFSGGGNSINYYFSTGYTKNVGIVKGDEIKVLRTRVNLDAKIADFIHTGVNAQFSSTDNGAVPVNASGIEWLSPYGSMFNDDGSLKLNPQDDAVFRNPFLDNYYKKELNRTNALFATLYTEIKLPFGFSYRISFQNRLSNTKNYQFWPSNTVTGGITHINGYGSRQDDNLYEWMVDQILRWTKTFGQHSFDATFLSNAEKLLSWSSVQTNENFQPSQNLNWHGLQFGSNPTINNDDLKRTGDALMARVNYSFADRYLLTASLRRDGFSAFGQLHPRAYFPAAAFAWRISQEPFFKVDWIDQLKLRSSWGVNGNRSVGTYAALANLDRNVYFDGTQVVTGVTNTSLANPNLKWEQTTSMNAGFDLTILKNRVNITADVYRSTTNDLLLNRQLPVIMGYQSVTTNLGEVSNKGLELTVSGIAIERDHLKWESSLNFSLNRNKIEKLWGDYIDVVENGKTIRKEVPDYANNWFPGQAIDRIWSYDIIGIWQKDQAAAARKYGLSPGDFRARDVNGDSAYRQFDDKVFLGWKNPRYQLGWRNDFTIFKNISCSFFLRADLGHKGRRADFNHTSSNTYDRSNTWALPYWSLENPSDRYPRLNVNYNAYEGGIALYEPASFIRMQDVSVGYSFSSKTLQQVKLKQLKLFVSARNLFVITKWTGWDPESLNSPMPRTCTIGLNASL